VPQSPLPVRVGGLRGEAAYLGIAEAECVGRARGDGCVAARRAQGSVDRLRRGSYARGLPSIAPYRTALPPNFRSPRLRRVKNKSKAARPPISAGLARRWTAGSPRTAAACRSEPVGDERYRAKFMALKRSELELSETP
jgi:hypothetical protein